MKLKNIKPHILLYLPLIFLLGCQKEKPDNKYTAVLFYPNTGNEFSIFYGLEGEIQNGILTLPTWNLDSSKISGLFSYNFGTRKLTHQAIIPHDSNRIWLLSHINPNKKMSVASDYRHTFIYNGIKNCRDKLVILDKYLRPLQQRLIDDTISGSSHIEPLGNGNYIITYYSYAPIAGKMMLCFDEGLNIKWKNNMGVFGSDDIVVSNNSIFYLQQMFGVSNSFTIRQYDFNGKFIKTRSSVAGNSEARMINSDIGINVFSVYSTTDKRNLLGITVYDNGLNIINTKLLDTKLFSYTDAIEFKFNSNIIKSGNNYFFTVSVDEFTTQNEKTSETKLVKINANLEIEWVKSLDKTRKRYDAGYLACDGKNFINIGKSIWNGVEGFSFIQTDMEGNIVK